MLSDGLVTLRPVTADDLPDFYAWDIDAATHLVSDPRPLLPITWSAFAFAAATGFLLFSSRAVKYASLWQFQAKMILLVLAGVNMAYFHLVTFRSVHSWDELAETPAAAKAAGAVSLCLWIAIVICGRLVGFAL